MSPLIQRSSISRCAALLALSLAPRSVTAQGTSLLLHEAGFEVEVFAVLPYQPTCLALSPEGGAFPAGLYVGVWKHPTCLGAPPDDDLIYRVAAGGSFSVFSVLLCEADPVALAFPPTNSPFGTDLFVSANNRDGNGFDGMDCGGTLQRIGRDGSWTDLTDLTGGPANSPCPSTTPILEPSAFAFGSAGFSSNIYILNSTDPPASLLEVSPTGMVIGAVTPGVDASAPRSLAFSPGGPLGDDLYVGSIYSSEIRTIDATGAAHPFAFLPNSERPMCLIAGSGVFGDRLFAVTTNNIWAFEPDGTRTQFASGLQVGQLDDGVEISPDGSSLYVVESSNDTHRILRIWKRPGSVFCFGDGAQTPCPCGNDNDASLTAGRAGCANGSSGGGAALESRGSSSVLSGDLTLEGQGFVPGQPGLLFQGLDAMNGGAGVSFGDGLRCVGTSVVRLTVLFADASGAVSTAGLDIAELGGVEAGDLRRYQLWYRDPAGSPCGAGFNLSNGFEVDWTL